MFDIGTHTPVFGCSFGDVNAPGVSTVKTFHTVKDQDKSVRAFQSKAFLIKMRNVHMFCMCVNHVNHNAFNFILKRHL